MKKVLIISLLALLSINAIAQNSENDKSDSKAVEFSSRQGSLMKKVFHPLGSVKGVEFEVLEMIDELSKDKMVCLRVKVYNLSSQDTYIGTLDSDEIDACLQSLNFIKDNVVTTNPSQYTECAYNSKDGITIGAFSGNKGWSTYVKTKKYTNRSAKYLKDDDLPALIEVLNTAKDKVKELSAL